MKPLHSHPDLLLREHIAQVRRAHEGIWQWHSERLVTEEVKELSRKLAQFHDLGKGSEPFQIYIQDPRSYRGDPHEKAHTPLSLLLSLLMAQKQDWPPLDGLLVAACVCAHHGALRSMPPVRMSEAFSFSRTLDDFAGGHTATALRKQLASLDLESLAFESGIDLRELGLSRKSIQQACDFLLYVLMPAFYPLSLQEKLAFRLKAQLLFSFLLEADKAFLAVPDPGTYLERKPRRWMPSWIDERIGCPEDNPVNLLRKSARQEVKAGIATADGRGIYSLTAPTGIGKTLLAATWALEKRAMLERETGVAPKVILALPYLSIIEQTAAEYRALLDRSGQEADGSWFLTSHSLSERKYAEWMEEEPESFFIDTWRTELVITTYDQMLLSLADPKAKYQMRFHNLCDALVIMDEVQSLPCRLWRLLDGVFQGLAATGKSQLLLMSATLPPFVSEAVPLLEGYGRYFSAFSRYELHFRVSEKLSLADFCADLASRLPTWLQRGERVLVTFNTRGSARAVYDRLRESWSEAYEDVPLLLLSADVTPRDRLRKIGVIKEGRPCIVVSTQCIEAGVDIDMDFVIRDFAPWDSIVQVAGRCNREGKHGKWLPVHIVDLTGKTGRRYSEMIYDDIALQVTRDLIGSLAGMKEEEVLSFSERYFEELDRLKDTGQVHLERFAQWQEDLPVRELLRGKEREQHTFLVLEQDPTLKTAMLEADSIEDRWKRRDAWRKLSGRIAQISVNLYARRGFNPQEIADPFLKHWVVREDFYDPDRGLLLQSEAVATDGTSLIF